MHPFRSTGVMGTARLEGGSGNRGRPVSVGGRTSGAVASTAGRAGIGHLRDILERMVQGHPINRIDELLPWNYVGPLAKAA